MTAASGTATVGGGEMGALTRSFDWARTPIGPAESWPQSLRTALSILLDARFPMYIAWGPTYVEFYNDAFRPILGDKHPAALGSSSADTWSEIWPDFVGPLFAKVRAHGEATYLEDALVVLNRHGYFEETYFTFCYSAIREEYGTVGGVLVTCMETTSRVIGDRRLRTLRELAAQAGEASTPADACRGAAAVFAGGDLDLPFTGIYLFDDDGRTARLAASSGLADPSALGPAVIDVTGDSAGLWPLSAVTTDRRLLLLDDLAARLTPVPPGPWPEPPRQVAIVPIPGPGQEGLAGFVIAGLDARHAFDDDYRGFLELVAGYLARAIANARAHDDDRKRAAALLELRSRTDAEKNRLLEEASSARADAEAKAEELQQTAAELEMQSEELRAATDELQEVNQRLAANETRLRLANSAAGIGTWELDVSDGTFRCDDQCRDVLGLPTTATFADLANAVHADDRDGVREVLDRARTVEHDADYDDFEIYFRHRVGSLGPRWINLTGRTFFHAGSGSRLPTRIVGTVHDVTARRRAEDALREETQVVETIQRVGGALASKLDLPSLVQTVTDEATKLTGAQFGAFFYNLVNEGGESYTLYTISGVPREAFSSFPMPRNTQVFEPTFHGTGIVRSADITQDERYGRNAPYFGMPKGHLPVVSYLAVPVISPSGEVLGGLFFGHEDRDVFSERHERIAVGVAAWAAVGIDNARLYDRERRARSDAESARAEAERANKAKTEFLATMSHELRTPLNAIAGYVDLLDLEIRGPVTTQQREDLRRIQRSQQHLLGLINDVLNFAKLEAGQVEIHLMTVPVSALLGDIEQLVAPQLAAKGLAYTYIDDGTRLAVRTDEEKARQIILNLLTNAVKFTGANGEVTVRCVARNGFVEISVTDTGRGIPPDKLDTIFEPFVQIDRHITPASHQGVGLGLAISRDLARAMGGDIAVMSEVGVGSTFSLTLPRADDETATG